MGKFWGIVIFMSRFFSGCFASAFIGALVFIIPTAVAQEVNAFDAGLSEFSGAFDVSSGSLSWSGTAGTFIPDTSSPGLYKASGAILAHNTARAAYLKKSYKELTSGGGAVTLQIDFQARVGESSGAGSAGLVRVGVSSGTTSTLFSGSDRFLSFGLDADNPAGGVNTSKLVVVYRESTSSTTTGSVGLSLINNDWYRLRATIRRQSTGAFSITGELFSLGGAGTSSPVLVGAALNVGNITSLDSLENAAGLRHGFSLGRQTGGGVKAVDNFASIDSTLRAFNLNDYPAVAEPIIRSIYPVANNAGSSAYTVIGLNVDDEAVIPGLLEPYATTAGDTVSLTGYVIPPSLAAAAGVADYLASPGATPRLHRLVKRAGTSIGYLGGPARDSLLRFDRIAGAPLDTTWATMPSSFQLTSTEDPAYATPRNPTVIYRKSRPLRRATLNESTINYTFCHELFLRFPVALTAGKTYTLSSFPINGARGTALGKSVFIFDDRKFTTPVLQVNTLGYETGSAKVAFLSAWLGDGGSLEYPSFGTFDLINETDATVFTGNGVQRAAPDQEEFAQNGGGGITRKIGNSKTFVYALDFTSFTSPGNYRIRIPGLGVSSVFSVRSGVWEEALKAHLNGFYTQRSGAALSTANYSRPRTFHPDDGNVIYATNPGQFLNAIVPSGVTVQDSLFDRIQQSIDLSKTVPGAWGGWHDAADFDRSLYPQGHFWAVNIMLDMLKANPAYFEQLRLPIPETDNTLPDILDEALWCTDLFLRIQQPDGGVPSALESIEHPRAGEASWLNSVPTAATPPSLESAYDFAGTAARISLALQNYSSARALAYRQAALAAVAWAEAPANSSASLLYLSTSEFDKLRNFAYAALFDLTGEAKWEDLFAATRPTSIGGLVAPGDGGGLFQYATSTRSGTRPDSATLRTNSRNALINFANSLITRQLQTSTYSLVNDTWARIYAHGNQGTGLAYAWFLTGEAKFRTALARNAHFMLGANPRNLSYTTGLGSRTVKPHNKDAIFRGLAVPAGIPVYGVPTTRNVSIQALSRVNSAGLYPALTYDNSAPDTTVESAKGNWPGTEIYLDDIMPELNEFTIEAMAGPVAIYSALAATDSVSSPTPASSPSGFSATALPSPFRIALAWTAAPGDGTGYFIQYSTDDGLSWNDLASLGTAATTYSHEGVVLGSSYTYRIRTSSSLAPSAFVSASVSLAFSAFDQWRGMRLGTFEDSGSAASSADPDGDGLSNLLEYALDLDPKVAEAVAAISASLAGDGNLRLTFKRARPASEMTYQVWGSSDLVAWAKVGPANPGGDTAVGGNVTVTDDFPVGAPRRFLRLQVVLGP